MSCWAIVPVKARAAGKQRLAHALSEELRARLTRVMLEHVLATLTACAEVSGVSVMTPDRDRLPPDVGVIPDASGGGLNESLHAALALLQRRGVTRVAILLADLPRLTVEDVSALVRAAEDTGIALAPDHTGTGTNAACVPVPTPLRFQFGPDSFARHRAEAARLGLRAASVTREGLAFDLDEPADLARLRALGDPRYAFL